ncbi:hypothetical protein GCM10007989_06070 [Devosia pacifica]|uniref:BioF2-like acetyltransferase domain-containing protein n=1 Tax=Devosia pacifica TaxID=1335967 RepID=A0A918VPU4_9HYPH|nr:GNAT family N-acetyltransferase [Devosia pacifica]GHA14197.1 hypothetical protein GCM10007989_06070 [Devosia pacifica]
MALATARGDIEEHDTSVLEDRYVRTAHELNAGRKIRVELHHDLNSVQGVWSQLASEAAQNSPGQSFGFTREWIKHQQIPANSQLYAVAYIGCRPAALLALHIRWRYGIRVLSFFPGAHVGCNGPVVGAALKQLSEPERQAFWRDVFGALKGADIAVLRSVPCESGDPLMCLGGIGTRIPVDTLYRAQFESWEECDKTQRGRSRRKHDRQQGDKLSALGEVQFEVLRNGDDVDDVINTMFEQRAVRFRAMGVRNPFQTKGIRDLYRDMLSFDSGVEVVLHVLRLEGRIVATRYNIVEGERMFCLISSMSEDPAIQAGSPGKQCLLRVMQSIFDDGYRLFDMGAGLTDEKRHWCNVQMPLYHHYVPLTPLGHLHGRAHQLLHALRARAKSARWLLDMRRKFAQKLQGAERPSGVR